MVVGFDPQHFAVDRTVEDAELDLIEFDDGLGRVVDVRDQDPQTARLVRVNRPGRSENYSELLDASLSPKEASAALSFGYPV